MTYKSPSTTVSLTALLALAFLSPSCRLTEAPDLSRPPLETLPIVAGEEPDVEGLIRSREIQLLADNQFRYTGGEGIVMTSALVDMFVPTAARPISLTMFSDDVYRWALEQGGDRPVIHLGDACDISCVMEYTWFAEIMRVHGAPWAMVPGNHDSMFMGSTMELDWEDGSWGKACKGGGGPMDKADFVALYLASLWEQMSDKPYAKEFAAALGTTPTELMKGIPEPGLLSERYAQLAKRIRKSAPSGSWSTKDPAAFITAVSWNINEKDSWRSYMAQRVSMDDGAKPEGGGFTGILLDSSQWWQQPQLIPTNITPPYEWNPGLSGEMLADQLMVVGKWMAEAREQGDGVALFAHHPIKEFTPKTRRALQYLWENNQVILLVSGHTHAGYIDIHKGIAPTALEINVASITDWPMEWRELSLTRYTRDGQDYFGVRSPRHTVLQELVKQGFDLRENWQSFEDGAEKLLDYRVTSDLAMDYDTGVGDLLTGGQWFKLSTLGTLSWLVMGQNTLVKALYNNVLPNVQGMELEHLARLRLCIGQMIEIWDKFPTTGHVTMENWETEETHLRELAKTAMKDKSTRAEVDAAQWPMVRFELGRQMADPEAMRMHRVLLCVWASMYEANKTAEPEVRDESFRMDRVAPTKKR